MRLAFYDPHPFANEYVSKMFLAPMRRYASAQGITWKEIDRIVPEAGWSLVCNCDYLVPEVARHFHDNGCKTFGISCIDSAYLAAAVRHEPELEMIDRVFMVSGVQATNISHATVIDENFKVRAEERQFLPWSDWARFDFMRRAGRIISLPYVPWHRLETDGTVKRYEDRRKSILFRGGNHFLRFVAYLFAMRNNAADRRSGFQSSFYFEDSMNPQFRYCDACRTAYRGNGRRFPGNLSIGPAGCTSPAPWGDKLDLSVPGAWNNRCPQSFYWLARKFAERHGPIDMAAVEHALNHKSEHASAHLQAVGEVLLYAEAKWEFSINMPQRFWEGAATGTVSYLPERSADQEYFPALTGGEDYLTFRDDFSDITAEVEPQRWAAISKRAHEAYVNYIQPSEYAINTNLLAYIFRNLA